LKEFPNDNEVDMEEKKLVRGFCPLSSSSKGNAIYIQTHDTKILIDCGLSGKRMKESLQHLGVSIDDIDAILITHEHIDHIRGLNILGVRHQIPILANSETAKEIVRIIGDCPKFHIFSTGESFVFKDLLIHPFSVSHDAADPVMFTIQFDDVKLGFCTDLGMVSSLVEHNLRGCDHLYVESNHQPEMVYASSRPPVYKERVLGRSGHLSNAECAGLIAKVHHEGLKTVTLAHLSEECNSPEMARKVVEEGLSRAGIDVELHIAPANSIGAPILITQPAMV
jgi:phosphoribosyl 1,2-cyclic phosphodiesterase